MDFFTYIVLSNMKLKLVSCYLINNNAFLNQARRGTMAIGNNIGATPVSVTQSSGLDQTSPSHEIGKMTTKSGTSLPVSIKNTATSSGLGIQQNRTPMPNGLSLGDRVVSQQTQAISNVLS